MAATGEIKNVTIPELLEDAKNKVLIIDVREVNEIKETGIIPGGVHIPLATLESAINSPDFEKIHGRPKPDCDTKIVLSCKSGARSLKAAEKLKSLGYTNLWNNSGGWLAYEKYRDGN